MKWKVFLLLPSSILCSLTLLYFRVHVKFTFQFMSEFSSRKSSAASLLCARKTNKRRRQNSPFKTGGAGPGDECPPYEEMALYYPQSDQRRPLILVGPPSIGRHELRQRLLDDTVKFAVPIPRKSAQTWDHRANIWYFQTPRDPKKPGR